MDVWENRVESLSEQDWCTVKSDSLYMGIAAEETAYSYNEGHVLLSQKLGKTRKIRVYYFLALMKGRVCNMRGKFYILIGIRMEKRIEGCFVVYR